MKEEFSERLLIWYQKNARSLPWRGHTDPYAIWVSEIMLQQTRVDTVIPYYQRWMQRFPNIAALAEASEAEVLKAWEGLGYYARARAMHRAARIIQQEHGGALPRSYSQLRKLPGIGAYTAAAIASIAFAEDYAVVDGNVKRVLARVLPYIKPVNTPSAEKELQALAQMLLAPGKASSYNQAVMELGALVCLPRNPLCEACPLTEICTAYKEKRQSELPQIVPKAKIPHLVVSAGVLRQANQVLITRRPPNGLLGGMWEYPGGKVEGEETFSAALVRELYEELGIHAEVGELLGTYRHAYTHFKVTLHAYYAAAADLDAITLNPEDYKWVHPAELEAYPMGKIDRMISRDLHAAEKSKHG
ncbi:MAG: A/G-specific adenine glycosylase [Anaerolineaceae bacterium]|nr:A/G-specific adenine glycosylase [Anaerolineaceae bacterium]